MVKSNRMAWRLANGAEIPVGMSVCHHCDNPPCCNPAHLFLGSHRENMADRDAKGRQACNPGRRGETSPAAKLTEADVLAIRRRYAGGGISQAALASEYGVAQSTISKITRRVRWEHAA
jgi:ribosome-binding protein aMBF1 (putative translation factor)